MLHTINNPNAYSGSGSDYFGGFPAVFTGSGVSSPAAISDSFIVIGANFEDDAGGSNAGKAYVFNTQTAELLYTIDNPQAFGTTASDQFGKSVALSGTTVIVSAPYEDDSGGTNSGKVYIYNIGAGTLNIDDNFNVQTSSITNIVNNAVTEIRSTGAGYVKFADTVGLRIPVGTDSQRPTGIPIGATRYNTDQSYLEIWDGTDWVTAAGGGPTVSSLVMEDLSDTYALIFG